MSLVWTTLRCVNPKKRDRKGGIKKDADRTKMIHVDHIMPFIQWQKNAGAEIQILKYEYRYSNTNTDTQIQIQILNKYSNTNTQIQILKHKYTNTNTQIQILKYKYRYSNTNTQIQILKYKYRYSTNTQTFPSPSPILTGVADSRVLWVIDSTPAAMPQAMPPLRYNTVHSYGTVGWNVKRLV